MKIEMWPIDRPVPYVRNARKIPQKAIDKVAGSIQEFGWRQPIVVDKDEVIIVGHTRLKGAQKLGLKEVPVHIAESLNEAQVKAYRLADNRTGEETGWDEELLSLEIKELTDYDIDIDLTGFNDNEVNKLLNQYAESQQGKIGDDEVPEKIETRSKQGDVWILGNHRLLCGDATNEGDVSVLMNGYKADLVFTDPPYGVNYGGGRAAGSTLKGARVKAHGMILNDDLKNDGLYNLIHDSIKNINLFTKKGASKYICFSWKTYSIFESAIKQNGLNIKSCIVWDKKSIGLGNSHYRPQHEFMFYIQGDWFGDKKQSDVWYSSRGDTGKYVHPTQKPTDLIIKSLKNSSKEEDIVLDLFTGSGSTLIACEKVNRKFIGSELDPKYCDTIIQRWEDFTGEKAKLNGTIRKTNKIQQDTHQEDIRTTG